MGHSSTTLVLFANFIFISYASWIDLSHTYNESTLHWPTNMKFTLKVNIAKYLDDGRWAATNNFCTGEHSGTHLDAPYHFNRNGWTVDKIPLDHLLGLRTAVIDISHRVNLNSDPVDLTIEDINAWEAVHGLIPRKGLIIMHSGWNQYWSEPLKYFNTSDLNDPSTFSFPGIDHDAAQWLVDNREIVGVGVDTASIDGRAPTYSHTTLTGKNIYLLENLAHTDQLPAKGAVVYVFPMNIENGTGAPARVVAEVDKAESYGLVQFITDTMQSISLL